MIASSALSARRSSTSEGRGGRFNGLPFSPSRFSLRSSEFKVGCNSARGGEVVVAQGEDAGVGGADGERVAVGEDGGDLGFWCGVVVGHE